MPWYTWACRFVVTGSDFAEPSASTFDFSTSNYFPEWIEVYPEDPNYCSNCFVNIAVVGNASASVQFSLTLVINATSGKWVLAPVSFSFRSFVARALSIRVAKA